MRSLELLKRPDSGRRATRNDPRSGIHETTLGRESALCTDLRGGVIKDCGHYIPEEQPEALAAEIVALTGTLEP
jgi:pimeloyl-ACP methyl ester carboxylesterase